MHDQLIHVLLIVYSFMSKCQKNIYRYFSVQIDKSYTHKKDKIYITFACINLHDKLSNGTG